MIPRECKRLAEVDFPIAVVGKHALAEKARRTGTPHQLHYWWAWRPLAACRAMLLALLLPDPCDPLCPQEFKHEARALLPKLAGRVGVQDVDLQRALLKFLGDYANWEHARQQTHVSVGRDLVKAAYKDEVPLIVDPFAGGGSIPLEALRLGADTFASDLNPVASLILKTKLRDIPRLRGAAVETLYDAGIEFQRKVHEKLASFYPNDADGTQPIAYLWARTVRCESPNCGSEIPLTRTFWLSKKGNRRRSLRYHVVSSTGAVPQVEFEVIEPKNDREVPPGSISGAKATCMCCGTVLRKERVQAQLVVQRGGADVIFDSSGKRIGGARLLAVVTVKPGQQGRYYRQPVERDYQIIHDAHRSLEQLLSTHLPNGLSPVPDEPMPPVGTLGFRVQRYGMTEWGHLFTARQKLTFAAMTAVIRDMQNSEAHSEGVITLLAMICTKLADRSNSIVNWGLSVECPTNLFKGNAMPMGWDFCESNVLSDSSASIEQSLKASYRNVEATVIHNTSPSTPTLADACESPLPDEAATVWFTDPPYYDAVPYSDLSDFFFVWFKRAMVGTTLLRDPFDPHNPLTPKSREAVQDRSRKVDDRPKDKLFFEQTMARAFKEGRRVLKPDGIGCVVFAHKTTEGWEALLSGMIKGGWVITGSWPIATERSARMRARDSAALATSVHLVCRPRVEEIAGDWGEVLRELPRRVGTWMERLQAEGIRGADLVFACIGPALEIYSRYSTVVDAEDREIPLGGNPESKDAHARGYLAYVWEVVGRIALEQVLGNTNPTANDGSTGSLEEDARLTALFLWTMQATSGPTAGTILDEVGDDVDEDEDDEDEEAPRGKAGGFSLVYDVVRRFAQPLGIHLAEWENRIIETKKGVVRLLPIAERAEQLFGEDGVQMIADRLIQGRSGPEQLSLALFPENESVVPQIGGGRRRTATTGRSVTHPRSATTLDRVHAAMLLQASGQANALRALLKDEVEAGTDFIRLANALSALYPQGSEEERLLDAMLLAVPR